jgi:putative tricarboxylic transport membrane protein
MTCMVEEAEPAAGDGHAVVGTRSVDIVVYLMLLAFAVLFGFDNWRTGMSWEADGPQAGYFPFYLSVLLGAASLYGLGYKLFSESGPGDPFVTGEQLRRVMQVFVPTLLFCVFMQWLGLYVASFILITGFMWIVGRIAPWKSLLTGFLFSLIMFVTFDIAFDVIMPKGPLEAVFGY